MSWDVARIWTSLDKTFDEIKWVFESSVHPVGQPYRAVQKFVQPERVDPDVEMDGSPVSNTALLKHLVWMFEETKKLAADGQLDKAQRWLGFIQGVAWAKGMTTLSALKEANRDATERRDYFVDDLVVCVGEGEEVFRVGKVSHGGEPSTGSALLLRKKKDDDDWVVHGWEDFRKLRIVAPAER